MIRDHRVQLDVASDLGTRDEKSGLDFFPARPRQSPVERYLKNILEGQIDSIELGQIRETVVASPERLLVLGQEGQDLIDLVLVQHSGWPPDKEPGFIEQIDLRYQVHGGRSTADG